MSSGTAAKAKASGKPAKKISKAKAKSNAPLPHFHAYIQKLHKDRYGSNPALWAPAANNLDEVCCHAVDALGAHAADVLEETGGTTVNLKVVQAACEMMLRGYLKDKVMAAGAEAVEAWSSAVSAAAAAKQPSKAATA